MDAHAGSLSPVSDPAGPPDSHPGPAVGLPAGAGPASPPAHSGRPVVLGVDGRRGRWCGALLTPSALVFLDLADAADVLAAADALGAVAVGVDTPIGLPARDHRPVDLVARRVLSEGGAASRAFPAPPQAVLDAPTHAEAVQVSRALSGRGVSAQAWHLRRAIADGAAMARDPRVVEVHPELSFRAMAGRVLVSKKTPAGRAERLAALARALPGVDLHGIPHHDDAPDAAAAAWSARRWAVGAAAVLGGSAAADGTPMRIAV